MHWARNATLILLVGLLLGACGAAVRKEIEGNNTGGVIPPALIEGKDPQVVADAHCAKWGTKARITFRGADAGGDVVFVCETAGGPAMLGGRPQPAATSGTQPPATAGNAPAKR